MRLRKGSLSADQLDQLWEDGYVIVENVFDPLRPLSHLYEKTQYPPDHLA